MATDDEVRAVRAEFADMSISRAQVAACAALADARAEWQKCAKDSLGWQEKLDTAQARIAELEAELRRANDDCERTKAISAERLAEAERLRAELNTETSTAALQTADVKHLRNELRKATTENGWDDERAGLLRAAAKTDSLPCLSLWHAQCFNVNPADPLCRNCAVRQEIRAEAEGMGGDDGEAG